MNCGCLGFLLRKYKTDDKIFSQRKKKERKNPIRKYSLYRERNSHRLLNITIFCAFIELLLNGFIVYTRI